MDNQIFNKESVEKIPPGTISISLQNVNEYWAVNDNAQKVADALVTLIHELRDEKRIIALSIVRLIIFTSNLSDIVSYWSEQLNVSSHITRHELGEVASKIMDWGEGELETIYAVIIIKEENAYYLLHEDPSVQAVGKHIVTHELAHLDTQFLLKDVFENTRMSRMEYLRYRLAYDIWAEFYAEYASRDYLSETYIQNAPNMLYQLLNQEIKAINQEIKDYRSHADIEKLWNFVEDRLFILIAQTGRCLGAICGAPNKKLNLDLFIKSLNEICIPWASVTQDVINQISQDGVYTSKESYGRLGDIVMKYFEGVGLFPELRLDESFYVHVPFTSDDTVAENKEF